MTREEAKKLGFTHIDVQGDWWKVDGDKANFQYSHSKRLWEYKFNDIQEHIAKGNLIAL